MRRGFASDARDLPRVQIGTMSITAGQMPGRHIDKPCNGDLQGHAAHLDRVRPGSHSQQRTAEHAPHEGNLSVAAAPVHHAGLAHRGLRTVYCICSKRGMHTMGAPAVSTGLRLFNKALYESYSGEVQAGPHREGDLRRQHAPGAHASQQGSERGVCDGRAAAVVLAKMQQPSRIRRQTLQRKTYVTCRSEGEATPAQARPSLVRAQLQRKLGKVKLCSLFHSMKSCTSCSTGSGLSNERKCSPQPQLHVIATHTSPSCAA